MTSTIERVRCAKCGEEFHPNFRICPSCGTSFGTPGGTTLTNTRTHSSRPNPQNTPNLYQGSLKKPSPDGHNKPDNWFYEPHAPWRRWAARFLDLSINGVIAVYAIAIVFYMVAPFQADQFFSVFETNFGVLLDVLFTSFAGTVLTGLVLGLTGSSLGKLIFGVRVSKLDGSLIGPINGVSRDLTVWMRGLAFGIPVIALFTQWAAYRRLKEEKVTSWDEGSYRVSYRKSGPIQYVLNFLGIVLILLVIVVSRAILQG